VLLCDSLDQVVHTYVILLTSDSMPEGHLCCAADMFVMDSAKDTCEVMWQHGE